MTSFASHAEIDIANDMITYIGMRKYSGFLLFVLVVFYKVTANSELANTEPFFPRGNAGLGFCEHLAITFSSTNQYRTPFYMCFCLKTPDLVHTVDSLVSNSWPTAL